MRSENPWIGIATAAAVCVPAAVLLVVTGIRCHDSFTPAARGDFPDWLWELGKVLGRPGLLISFVVAAATVSLLPIALLIHHLRHPGESSFSDYDVRRALGRVPPQEGEVKQS
jgi:hypothetical protein